MKPPVHPAEEPEIDLAADPIGMATLLDVHSTWASVTDFDPDDVR